MARMLLQTIEQIAREKNIALDVIVDAVEEAMAVASKKYYKTEEDLRAELNRETGEVDVYAVKQVVETVVDPELEMSLEEAQNIDAEAEEGSEIKLPRSTEELGRIAAQAAKQVIFQKVRDAERDNIYNEYVERVGELVTGIVKRFERGDMIIDLGRTEGLLPRREQSRAEHYNIGDRIRVVIIDVLKVSRGPQIVVSRVSPELLLRLFEMEVPEIYDGTVIIKGAVREGGDRAKVAVHSIEPDVDPVGACVGMRGSRVQSIIRELRGEKIDIVQWSSDRQQYAINGLKPARVNRVTVLEDDEEPHLEVIVDEDQLSLAIGKRGQNVRLAGKLLGAKIDIKSEEDKRREVEKTLARMVRREEGVEILPGVGPSTAETLREGGFSTIGSVADAPLERLTEVPGIGIKTAEKLQAAALEILATEPEEEEIEEVVDTAASVLGEHASLAQLEAEAATSGPSALLASLTAQAEAADEAEPEVAERLATGPVAAVEETPPSQGEAGGPVSQAEEGAEDSEAVTAAVEEPFEETEEVLPEIEESVPAALEDPVEEAEEVAAAVEGLVEEAEEVPAAVEDSVEEPEEVPAAVEDSVEEAEEVPETVEGPVEGTERVTTAMEGPVEEDEGPPAESGESVSVEKAEGASAELEAVGESESSGEEEPAREAELA